LLADELVEHFAGLVDFVGFAGDLAGPPDFGGDHDVVDLPPPDLVARERERERERER